MLVLIEMTPLDAASGNRVTLRAASADDRAITGLNGVRWWPAIKATPTLDMTLFDGDFTSPVDAGTASFTVLTDKLARLDASAPAYRWAGAGIKIYAGDSGDAWPWTQWFAGRVDSFQAQANQLRITAKVDTDAFQKNALTLTYAGTGGIEGGADLKNKVKPWLFGRALNVEPVLIDATNSVFQFSAYGPIQAVNNLYERASDFGATLGDYATYAALVAATIPAGRWATCLASGLVRLGAPPYGVITGDVDGDKPSGTWIRTTGAIINRILTNAGVSSGLIDSASLTALDTAVPYNVNLFLADQTTLLDLCQRLARPCNAQAGVSWLGKLFVTRPVIAGSAALTLDAQGRQKPGVTGSVEVNTSPPYWRVEMGAQRSWRVHSFDEIAFFAALVNRGAYSGPETYREGNIVQDQSSSWLYVNPAAASGNAPPTLPTTSNAYWQIMAGKGSDGSPGSTGSPGSPGSNTAVVTLYQRAAPPPASAPATPSAATTYTFATATLSGTLGSWSQTIPAANGNPLYVTTAVASGSGATDTIGTVEWTNSTVIVQDGPTVVVTPDKGGFTYVNGALSPSSQTATFTASLYNVSGTIGWTAKNAAGTTVKSGTGTTFTISTTEIGSNDYLLVQATVAGTVSPPATLLKNASVPVQGTDIGVENGADITSYVDGPTTVNVACDTSGTPTTTALAQVWNFKLYEQGAQVTSGITWSTNTPTGLTSPSITNNSGNGTVAITGMTVDRVDLVVTAARSGKPNRQRTVTFTKDRAPPPVSGGSGGGSGGTADSQTGGFNGISSTTASALSGDIAVTVGSVGTVSLVAGLTLYPSTSGGVGSWTVRFQWYRWNGSAYVAIGSTFDASTSVFNEPPIQAQQGDASNAQTYTSTVGATETFKLYAWLLSGSRLHTADGQISAQG